MGREAETIGLPLARAMFIHYPYDAVAANLAQQFLLGRDMLIAPVLDKGGTHVHVYLPPGDIWVDVWTTQQTPAQLTPRLPRRVDAACGSRWTLPWDGRRRSCESMHRRRRFVPWRRCETSPWSAAAFRRDAACAPWIPSTASCWDYFRRKSVVIYKRG